MYIPRSAEDTVRKIAETFPVLLVTGPRQVGKTTLLERLAEPERKIVTLDDPDIRHLAGNDPALFLQRYTPPVLIDEIQYAPGLLPYIKMAADRSGRNGDFWLTGSQSFVMMKNVGESLAGRVGIVEASGTVHQRDPGRSFGAFTTDPEALSKRLGEVKKLGLNELYGRIFRGSMPGLHADERVDWETYYRSYVDTYLKRDIGDLTQADEMAFYNFMTRRGGQGGPAGGLRGAGQGKRRFAAHGEKNGSPFSFRPISQRLCSPIQTIF